MSVTSIINTMINIISILRQFKRKKFKIIINYKSSEKIISDFGSYDFEF